MELTLLDTIFLIGAVQGFFLALLLHRRRVSNQLAARYLLVLAILVSLMLLAKVSFQPDWMERFAEIILLPDVILFALGPCLYLFVRHLLRLPPLSRRQLWWHAFPAIFHVVVTNTLLGMHIAGHWRFLNAPQVIFGFYAIEGLGLVSLTYYLLKSRRLVQSQPIDQYSPAPVALQFLPLFFNVGLMLIFSWACSFFFHIFYFDPDYIFYQIFWASLVVYTYWLTYTVLLQVHIFDLPAAPKLITSADENRIQHIKQYIEQQRPYLEPNLKLEDLAQRLELPRHELSRLINQGFGQGFFDVINSYRIREFIQLRSKEAPAGHSILQSAYQVGFNSKSAFNRAFRKMKGTNPSQYFKEQHLK